MALFFFIFGLCQLKKEANGKYADEGTEYVKEHYGTLFKDTLELKKKLPTDLTISEVQALNRTNTSPDSGNTLLKELYKSRVSDYRDNNGRISTLTQLLAALVALGLYLLFYKPNQVQVPIISLKLPNELIHIFVVIGIIYVWIQLGLAINSGIDSRLALHQMTLILESLGRYRVAYAYSDAHTFVDNGILDTWFNFYHEIFKDGLALSEQNYLARFGLFAIIGVFWAVIHSTCITVSASFWVRKKGFLTTTLFILAMAALGLADIAFVAEFKYASFLFAWIWTLVVAAILWWNIYGIPEAEKLSVEQQE